MPVCGPNCMGILNPQARVTTYKQNVRDPAAIVGNVGIVSQSGSVCIALLSDLAPLRLQPGRCPPATKR